MVQKKNSAVIAKAENKEVKNETSKKQLPMLDVLQRENEEMKKQLQELLKVVNAKPQNIDEQIKYFEKKKERINHLHKFEETQQEIEEVLDTLTANQDDEIFTNENFRLIFGHRNSYNDEINKKIVSISHTGLIINFVENLKIAVSSKIEELKKEISL